MAELIDYLMRHEGEDFLVLGMGESVSAKPVPDWLSSGPGDDLICPFWTIGCNDATRLASGLNYLVLANPRTSIADERWEWVKKTACPIFYGYTEEPIDWQLGKEELLEAGCDVVNTRLRRGPPDFSNPNVLPCHNTTPYIACALAHHMGARRIGLLGVDFTAHSAYGKTGKHQLDTSQKSIELIDRGFGSLREAMLHRGTDLRNLSPISRLESLPLADFDFLRRRRIWW